MNCTNPHMSLSHQSVLVEVMKKSPFLTVKWLSAPLMRNAKQKRKKKRSPVGNEIMLPAPLSQKMERWIYLLNPSGLTGLEPAASALTGRCSDRLNYNPRKIRCTVGEKEPQFWIALRSSIFKPKNFFILFLIGFHSNYLVSPSCNRDTNDILLNSNLY